MLCVCVCVCEGAGFLSVSDFARLHQAANHSFGEDRHLFQVGANHGRVHCSRRQRAVLRVRSDADVRLYVCDIRRDCLGLYHDWSGPWAPAELSESFRQHAGLAQVHVANIHQRSLASRALRRQTGIKRRTPRPILRNFSRCTISKAHVWCSALTLSKVTTS